MWRIIAVSALLLHMQSDAGCRYALPSGIAQSMQGYVRVFWRFQSDPVYELALLACHQRVRKRDSIIERVT